MKDDVIRMILDDAIESLIESEEQNLKLKFAVIMLSCICVLLAMIVYVGG